MEEKKQLLIAHQDIFNLDGTLNFMLVMEYVDCEGEVKHAYKAKYPNLFFAPDPFLNKFQIVFN
ncbi:MAG TPA: hypothetical protein PLH91_12620 [Tenuifilaceae bacterium]|nr:hypothetical protein [Tenuifilaceae bacterium]HPI46071.1 hypothetical protein [Tenuifilaceae bacterium]HPN23123.1 hypothetical protein [Tenuifilaceae bacterium]